MHKVIIIILTILLLPFSSNAQKWKRQRVEYSFGFGASNFLGDLGGRDQKGTNFLLDFELKSTRYAVGFGYRYQLANRWYVKGNLLYAKVSGNDNLTLDPARNARQLNFKTNIIELSGQMEFMIIKQKTGSLYKLKGVKGKSWFKFEVYAIAGLGAIWYDPKGLRDDKWHRLAPLNTEGQGLPGGPNDYSQFSVVVPYGIGIRRSVLGGYRTRRFGSFSVSLELTMRKTFTDYIDDVSTNYYNDLERNPNDLSSAYGSDALYFHDPSNVYNTFSGANAFTEPQQRGDAADKDTYMLGIISFNYKPAKRRRNLPKF